MSDAERQDLPERILEIAEVIGLDGAMRLVDHWGGLRLYIPEPDHITGAHPLARRLGLQRARALATTYEREKIDVPNCKPALHRAWDARLLEEKHAGASARQLAIRHGVTERTVWLALARARARAGSEDDSQADLFAEG
ncbi:hypothetical protein [Sediminicurvatus halobius]|uniref:Mor transcription activator domain-containing protein n=1 Tax=Sediminicurvatus halobius TaxID=2182432 RepID=A0A2U2N1B0_9GAMM|nr:hypothetical protein [Spiribacter halobius]PWG62838.1 hypothetical protein DEM34_10755 [Spiribacter halobius]UEX77012.1 hypothetical protein LMH63_13800 [Spiribacter halobius]